jgi:hypothetical protein
MRSCYTIILGRFVAAAVFSLALPIQMLAFTGGAFAQTSLGPAAPAASPETAQAPPPQALKNWRDGKAHAPPPEKGCFTLSYPNTQWQEVPCQAPPAHPFLPARGGPGPSIVGDGDDVVTSVTAGHIALAVGSFDSVTNVTSVNSEFGSNDYSLQLNVNTFSSPLCSNSATPASCIGWQQFVYGQFSCNGPCVFMQYWLIHWGSTTCPNGWTFFDNGGDDECYTNSSAVYPPQAQPLSNLGNLAVIAEANSGGMDTVIFSTGSTLYSVQNNDSVLGLAANWNSFEYNLVGDCCGSEATINNGAAIVVRASVDNGGSAAPTCLNSFSGFTAETNSLSLASTPSAQMGTMPSVVFTENSAGGASSPCASALSLQQSSLLLLAAVLPESRSARVGGTVTAFASVLNAGPNPVAGCNIAPLSGLPGTFAYQTTNPSTNAVTGSPNTPVVIPGHSQFQTFVIGFTPSAAFAPTNSVYSFSCTDVPAAPIVNGLNTLLLSASTTPTPDVVALGGTIQNDGIVHVTNGSPPTGVFAVATDNLGSGDTITVATNTGTATLPITVTVCQTNPSTGACLQTPSPTVATTMNANSTATFGIFVSASATVPFNPANSRIFVTFTDSTHAIRGETSVAVETQ